MKFVNVKFTLEDKQSSIPEHLSLAVGYIIWAHNLVAIARLRGASLRKLTVSESSIDFDPVLSVYIEGDPLHHLVKEVSLGLGRVWKPCLDSALVLMEPTLHFHHEVQAFSAGM